MQTIGHTVLVLLGIAVVVVTTASCSTPATSNDDASSEPYTGPIDVVLYPELLADRKFAMVYSFSDEDWQLAPQMSGLFELWLMDCSATTIDGFYMIEKKAPNLRALRLDGYGRVSFEMLRLMLGLPSIEEIDLCRVRDVDWTYLSGAVSPSLKRLIVPSDQLNDAAALKEQVPHLDIVSQ